MPRRDLMELTADDLASLTNRGTVKRAQKEIESNEVAVEFEEGPEDRVLATWSDGFVCEFLHGKSIHDAKCSSGVLGISRHVIRSVLAYQKYHASSGDVTYPLGPPTGLVAELAVSVVCDTNNTMVRETAEPLEAIKQNESTWDPGEITDEQLIAHFGKSQIQKAKTRFELGILVELTRGRKPFAVFLDERCFVRFMVPHDLQYATADCGDSALARFVAMTVWAFRQLPKEKLSGTLALSLTSAPIPTELLDSLDSGLLELVSLGVANSTQSSVNRWLRLESVLRNGELAWPAELVSELIHQVEMYMQHDALFDPESPVLLIGELVARSRAIRSNTMEVPQLLIRGTKFDTAREIASSKYVGIGTEVKAGRKHTTVSVFMQDTDTGLLATIQRTFANEAAAETATSPAMQSPPSVTTSRSFESLVATPIYRSVRLAGLAGSKMLLKSGKRTPSSELKLPRSAMAVGVNPQLFRWETLMPPLLADSFAELADRIKAVPPSYLRPRMLTDAVHVVPISSIQDVDFDAVRQSLTARLVDSIGGYATMAMSYESRNNLGFKSFAAAITNLTAIPKFVAGRFRLANEELVLQPMQIVVEDNTQRYGLSPYLLQKDSMDTEPAARLCLKRGLTLSGKAENTRENDLPPKGQTPFQAEPNTEEDDSTNELPQACESGSCDESSPITAFLAEFTAYLAETILMGVQNNSGTLHPRGLDLVAQANRAGFLRIAGLVNSLTNEFQSLQNSRDRPPDLAARMICELAMIDRIASR